MYRTIALLAVLVAAPAPAASPDVQPGKWEYTNTTSFSGAINIPDQTMTYTQCVTGQDVDEADTYLQNADNCEVRDRDIGSGSVSFTLICPGQQGGEARMSLDLRLMGDRVEGESHASVSMSGHSMEMHTRIQGRRLGDC